MKVRELIATLQTVDQELEVEFHWAPLLNPHPEGGKDRVTVEHRKTERAVVTIARMFRGVRTQPHLLRR